MASMGFDLDFETPSLNIDPEDTEFQHPTTTRQRERLLASVS